MSKYDIIESIILYLIYLLLTLLLYLVQAAADNLSFLPPIAITLALIILFHDKLKLIVRRFVNKHYYYLLNHVQQTLETLNMKLNRSFRYHEVTHELEDSFKKIFRDVAYAFYIFENNKFYPAFSGNLNDGELMTLGLDASYFRPIQPETLLIEDYITTLRLPESFALEFKKSKLYALLPFHGHNQTFAFLLVNIKKVRFYRDKPTRLLFQKIQRKGGLILENTGLFVDLEKKNFETRKLIEVSQRILSSLNTKDILDFILNSLQSLINFDAAAIFLVDKSGKNLLNTSSRGYDSGVADRLHLKVGQGACGWVVESKKIDIIDDVRMSEHYLEIRKNTKSQISIPMIFEETVLGVICMESNKLNYFNENQVDILNIFANQAAIAIHNARQLDIRLAKQAYEHELINASMVQRDLLIKQLPKLKDLRLTAENIPSKLVSGDLYDVIKFNETTLGFIIGDVSGKGAPAALMMTLILAGFRTQNKTFMTACDVVNRLNNLLCQTTIEGKYATLFYGIIDMENHKVIYTNAGHNPPILISAGGEVKHLTKGGIVLGFIGDQDYIQEEVEFKQGDILVAYTDGVSETMNHLEEEFGENRIIEIVKSNQEMSVHQIKQEITNALRDFAEFENPADDITLLICKHL
ncbi:MAG: SpoIIE family protein phosphatase [Calditrichaceae bacterium]